MKVISRGLGLVLGALALACSASPAPPSAPPPPSSSAQPLPDEPCSPEGPYAPLPSEDGDPYDDFLRQDAVDPYAVESPYDETNPQEAAKHHYEVGRAADAKQQWEEAHRAFLESWGLLKRAATAFALVRVTMSLGRHREALRYIDFVLRSPYAKDWHRTDATDRRTKALSLVASLRVAEAPQGSCIVVDGLMVGRLPLSDAILVDAGRHRLEARRAGKHVNLDVEVTAGSTMDLRLSLAGQ